MPLPTVTSDDSEKSYIEKCMISQGKEKDLTDEKVRKQSLAICFSKFRDRFVESRGDEGAPPKSMFQILKETD